MDRVHDQKVDKPIKVPPKTSLRLQQDEKNYAFSYSLKV